MDQYDYQLEFSKEEMDNLPPDEKKEYYRMIIKRVLEDHPDGMTISDICMKTRFDYRTVAKHLDFLTAVREVYKKEFGLRTVIYYPNGQMINPFNDKTFKMGNSYFNFKEIENKQFGNFLYIQEKQKDMNNLYNVIGGIIIPIDCLDQFIQRLLDIKKDHKINLRR